MQIPTRWWVHIIPGLLLILSIMLLMLIANQRSFDVIATNKLEIVILPILAMLSYVGGLFLNASLIELVLPIFKRCKFPKMVNEADSKDWVGIDQYLNSLVVQNCRDGYQNMVFWRSLLASCIVLSISVICYVCSLNWSWYYVVILVIIEVILIIVLCKSWWKNRAAYDSYLGDAIQLSRRLMQ
jgi:hypothetical protein